MMYPPKSATMKHLYAPKLLSVFVFAALALHSGTLYGQCNVNEKYDKIISGYHSSIALKDNGVYAVWGSSMQSTGANDQLAPQDINSTNYSALTGTIYKAALGGKSAGPSVDQAILLTSDGLWAWGVVGNVLKSTVKSTAAFGRITSPSGGVGSTALGLPTGVAPTDVQSLFATYQTLILVTKIVNNVGGDVYILTQTSLAAEANGGTPVNNAGSSSWKQVKIDASTNLTNVTSARGQVYNASNNAFIAVTAAGLVYTWGNTTYTGSGAIAARNYATLVTLPQENAINITPKMIGITGGGASGATTCTNTYFVLSTTGNLYSMGNNSLRQCGDFTTTERTSWVKVKKSAAANDYLTNVNFFSCQEHNASYPAVAAITSTGNIYTWGHNSSGMLGRTDDGTAGGTLSTTTFDPGNPVGFTGTAVSIEMGGHTMVYTKTGSTQFCYVGHYTNGSMGDGTSGNNGASAATSLKHDCASTPNISICGYVPVTPSTTTSTISVSSPLITANGISTSTITIRLKDQNGNNLTSSGGVVTVYTDHGTLGTVVDNNDGTYTVILTSDSNPATASITYEINGSSASSSASVVFSSSLPVKWGDVKAFRKYKTQMVEWVTEQALNVSHFTVERSLNGIDWKVVADNIAVQNGDWAHAYSYTDKEYLHEQVYYRIREADKDGKFAYSAVLRLDADAGYNRVIAYPSPTNRILYIGNVEKSKLSNISLYAISGDLVKNWNQPQDSYDLGTLAPGIYILKVTLTDGTNQTIRIKKT